MNYSKIDLAVKNFCAVRDALEPHTSEYRLAFSQPLNFYYKHTTKQAIKILKQQAKQRKD